MTDYQEEKPLWQPRIASEEILQPRLLEDPVDGSPPDVTNLWYGLAQDARGGGVYDLRRFMDAIQGDFSHSYGSKIHAIAAVMIAAGNLMAARLDATDAQTDYAMRECMTRWFGWEPTAPVKIVRYEKLLDPANAQQFEHDMTQDIWQWLRREAHRRLIHGEERSVEERLHLEKIVTGEIPFGLKLRRDI